MNILFLALDVDLMNQRGDAIHARELARFLAARGNNVDFVTATKTHQVPYLGPNVKHHRCPHEGDLRVVYRCTQIARQSRSTVLYERRISPKIAFGVSLLRQIPFVVEVNGIEEEAALQGRTDVSPWQPLKIRARRLFYRRAQQIVTVSEGLASLVATHSGLPEDRTTVIPNGVDAEHFVPMDATEARRRLGLTGDLWIVFAGNLVPWQGLDTALNAMSQILESSPTSHLAIVGDGMMKGSLTRLAKALGVSEALAITGSVPHEQLPMYLGAATVCIAPFTRTRNEMIGLSPLKIYEYLACGRPVVASAIPGVVALLDQSGGGVSVPPDDPKALAHAILGLLANPDEAGAMGARGREFVVKQCTWAHAAERVEGVLSNAVRRLGPRMSGR